MRYSLIHIGAIVLSSALVRATANITVAAGVIQGTQCSNSTASAYLALPYAQPPIDNLRFAPPKVLNSTYDRGTYQATKKAPACLQFGDVFIEQGPQSEDW
jgi:carboxylesterase type B